MRASKTATTQPREPTPAPAPACVQDPPAAPRPWVLYLLECAGERLYAGITTDLAARFLAHAAGRGARFTRAFPPLRIVAASALPSRSAALKAEYALKQQARDAKLRFLAGCGVPLDLLETPHAPGRPRRDPAASAPEKSRNARRGSDGPAGTR